MTPSGRTRGKSPPDIGTTLPERRGPSMVPEATYTAPRLAPIGLGATHRNPVNSSEIVKACSRVGTTGFNMRGSTLRFGAFKTDARRDHDTEVTVSRGQPIG